VACLLDLGPLACLCRATVAPVADESKFQVTDVRCWAPKELQFCSEAPDGVVLVMSELENNSMGDKRVCCTMQQTIYSLRIVLF
jgi:hypothetical protein